jgi:ABC-type multidrug transport system ATPase subunit
MGSIVQVSHLAKNFGDIKAVDDLSFTVERGEVYGFLGQNGAGKSTTIRMLLTLVRPSGGQIEIFGLPLSTHKKEILRNVGAIIERPDLYKYLTAKENLSIFARMSGKRIKGTALMDQLEMVGLASRADSRVKTFSQGMKQRLGIAVALVHDPELIILDEPTNGLDPQGIADMRNLILHLSRERKKTIIVSSHLLSEMELISDSMIIIDKGKKLVEGKVSDLFDPAEMILELSTTDNDATRKILAGRGHELTRETEDDVLYVRITRSDIPRLAEVLVGTGIGIISLHPRHSLEDYFLSLTNPDTRNKALTV